MVWLTICPLDLSAAWSGKVKALSRLDVSCSVGYLGLPSESPPGAIRGDYAIDVGRNICRGSDSVENVDNVEKEIKFWFPEGVCNWSSHSASWSVKVLKSLID